MLSPYVLAAGARSPERAAPRPRSTAADLAKPWPLALVVDRLLDRQAPFELDGADVRLLVAMAALVLRSHSPRRRAYAADLWLQAAGERITHDLRVSVYDHLQRLSLGSPAAPEGRSLTRVTGDVNAMGDLFSQSLGHGRVRAARHRHDPS